MRSAVFLLQSDPLLKLCQLSNKMVLLHTLHHNFDEGKIWVQVVGDAALDSADYCPLYP